MIMSLIKTILYSFMILFTTCASFGQPPPIETLKMNWIHYKLKNGIQIILQPDLSQSEVSVEFWVHTGSKDETNGKFGFAHFFEHTTPYGLLKDSLLLNIFRSIRTNSNAQTRKDYTRYFVQVKPDGLNLALKYTADRLKADTSAISDIGIETHRRNILNEMNRQEANPLYSPSITTSREAATFGQNHVYGHSNYGSIWENESFTADEVKRWYEQYFIPNNIILYVVGNFDTEKTKHLIDEEFAIINRKGNKIKLKKLSLKTERKNLTLSTSISTHFLSISWAIPSYGSKDEPSLQLIGKVLDERLTKAYPASITKSGSSDLFALYELAGQFGVFASFLSLSDSSMIENYLNNAINEIIDYGIAVEELENAKRKTIETVKASSKNLGFTESRTDLLGEGLLFTDNPDYYFLRLKKQAKLTTRDLQKSAKKWFSDKGARILIISNKL